jgi:addiction module HigA family antidote
MAELRPVHPGEILREEFMVPFGLNANSLALALHVPAPSVYEIIRERRGISPKMALRLGVAFKTTPDCWLNLQSEYNLRVARTEKEAMLRGLVRPVRALA